MPSLSAIKIQNSCWMLDGNVGNVFMVFIKLVLVFDIEKLCEGCLTSSQKDEWLDFRFR